MPRSGKGGSTPQLCGACSSAIRFQPKAERRPFLRAGRESVWSRCEAESSPERGFYYHPSRHSAGQPIVAGWAYQWIVELGFARESWVAPMDVLRVRPTENPNEVAAEQIKKLLQRAPGRCDDAPLFVFDAGYDPVQLQTGMESWNAHRSW
jgi:hypothetical protein